MLTVIVIPAEMSEPIEKREINGDLAEYQEIVDGLIAATDIPKLGASVFSNDEGLLMNLPINVRANALLWTYAPEHVSWTLLVGDVVLVGLPDEEGSTTSVPEHVVALMEKVNHVR